MLVGALVCPHPPLLLPGLSGSADVVPDLRAAIRDGIEALAAAGPELLILVGSADRTGQWEASSPSCASRYSGGRVRGADAGPAAARPPGASSPTAGPAPALPLSLPLSLSVGQELLDAADWPGPRELVSVAATASPGDCLGLGRELAATGRRAALLVLGDGSARRTEKAPGYLDPRAADYDEQALRGLSGDLDALRTLDPALGAELLVAGRAPWQVLAGAAGAAEAGSRAGTAPPGVRAEIRYAGDPFGVYYVVSSWAIA